MFFFSVVYIFDEYYQKEAILHSGCVSNDNLVQFCFCLGFYLHFLIIRLHRTGWPCIIWYRLVKTTLVWNGLIFKNQAAVTCMLITHSGSWNNKKGLSPISCHYNAHFQTSPGWQLASLKHLNKYNQMSMEPRPLYLWQNPPSPTPQPPKKCIFRNCFIFRLFCAILVGGKNQL